MFRTCAHLLLVGSLALAPLTACKGKDEKKDEAAALAAQIGRDGGPAAAAAAAMHRNAMMHRSTIAPVTVDEVKPLIPALAHSTPVGLPGSLTAGRQVKAVLCVTGASTADAVADQVVAALQKVGFTQLNKRAHPRTPEILRVTGEKTPYRVGATIERGPYPDCPLTAGKTKVVLSYFKRLDVAGGAMASPAMPMMPRSPMPPGAGAPVPPASPSTPSTPASGTTSK